MSELDLDIRAVSSASFGARASLPDTSQVQAASDDATSVVTNTLSSTDHGSTTASLAASQPSFRYDSFRFIYQSDYGRIVLVDQNPETGKAVSQIPSQRALQLYAEQRRADVVAQSGGSAGAVQASTDTAHRGAISNQAAGKIADLVAPAAVTRPTAPLPAAHVSTPAPALAQPSVTPVNITI